MTTATAAPRKRGSALKQLEKLEAEQEKANVLASRLARDFNAKQIRLRDLIDERRRLIHNQPDLVDHRDAPADKENAVADVDREIRGLGDLDDLGAQLVHARRLLDKAKQRVGAYCREHLADILEGLRDQAEAVAENTNAVVDQARQGAEDHLNFIRRVTAVLAAAGADTRVPGLDAAADLSRLLTGWQIPAPIPEVDR